MWQAAGGPERVQGTAPQRSYYTLYLDDTHAGTIVSFPHTPHWMRACLATLQAPHTFIIMITRGVSSLSSSPMSAIFILALCFYVYIFSFIILPLRSQRAAPQPPPPRVSSFSLCPLVVFFLLSRKIGCKIANCAVATHEENIAYIEDATICECVCECTRGIMLFRLLVCFQRRPRPDA
jgi:predicted secreted protein